MQVNQFTTDRYYGPTPQLIKWAVVIDRTGKDLFGNEDWHVLKIAFVDKVRHISGIVTWLGLADDKPTKEDVLRLYDYGGYDSLYSVTEREIFG